MGNRFVSYSLAGRMRVVVDWAISVDASEPATEKNLTQHILAMMIERFRKALQ
jgi:hypothetical protein